MSSVAEIRKAIGGAIVAAVTDAYAVLSVHGFDFHAVTAAQWQSVVIAGLGAFTTVYHLPNTVSARVRASEGAAESVLPGIVGELHTTADGLDVGALLAWAEGVDVTAADPDADELASAPAEG